MKIQFWESIEKCECRRVFLQFYHKCGGRYYGRSLRIDTRKSDVEEPLYCAIIKRKSKEIEKKKVSKLSSLPSVCVVLLWQQRLPWRCQCRLSFVPAWPSSRHFQCVWEMEGGRCTCARANSNWRVSSHHVRLMFGSYLCLYILGICFVR